MAGLDQTSTTTYIFKIANEHVPDRVASKIKSTNKVLQDSQKAFKDMARAATDSSKVTSDAVSDAADKVDKSSRKFIQSISGIYAAFVLAPKIVQEFGEALKEGAAGKDVRESFENLAESVGVSAERLLSSMQDAARGTVTEIELMRQANRAFIAGGAEFALAIPQLFEIARAAAVATGQDVAFVLDSLTKGIAKASIKLIDNAEVYIKVGESVEEYAEKLGLTADTLDTVQKRQAILQAVLEQGEGLVEDIGAEVDLATDAFLKYETAVDNAKQATAEFLIDAVGPGAAGQVKAISDVVVGLSSTIQTLALLKIASGDKGLIGSLLGTGAAAAGVTTLIGKLTAAIPYIALFAGGAFAADKVLQSLADEIEDVTGFKLPSFGKQLELTALFMTNQGQAARELYREINLLGEFSEITMDAQAAAREELERTLNILRAGRGDYIEYIRLIRELNSVLEDGEQAISAWSEAMFNAVQLASGAVAGMGVAIQAQINANAALEARAARAAEVKPDIERALKAIQNNLEKRHDLYDKFNKDLESEMRRHALRMQELSIDAAFDRIDAIRDAAQDGVGAEKEYQRDIEDAHRQHGFNLEAIERRFQRRMLEIRERFALTVTKAARRRDVLAIINAREQRILEERAAKRDRDDSLHDEARNFQESLRQAQQALQERKQELKDSLAEELRDIDENLRRRQEKEDRAHQERLRKMKADHVETLAELEFEIDKEIELIQRKRNFIQGWLNSHPIQFKFGRSSGDDPNRPTAMQHGFSGVVQGPRTFKVEPGVTEYVYASGALGKGGQGGRETPSPSAGATSAMALQHSIRGGVNVGMSGLSSQVLSGLGPMLQDSVGQAIVDAITGGIMGSF